MQIEQQQQEEQFCTWSIPEQTDEPRHPCAQLIRKCEQIKDCVLVRELGEVAKEIQNFFRENTNNESTKPHICSLQVRKYQEEYLPLFLELFMNLTLESFIRVDIAANQIFNIVNQIADYMEDADRQKSYLFLAPHITNLSLDNLRLLSYVEDLNQKCFILLPTEENIDQEITHFSIFNNKNLFCTFFYQCVLNVTAYYPKQLLQFITDFDYYPLPFKEVVRRFICQLAEINRFYKQPSYECNFSVVVVCLQRVYSKVFLTFKHSKITHLINVLKVALDAQQKYKLSQSDYSIYVNLTENITVDRQKLEHTLITQIRDRLIRQFQKKQLNQYCRILSEEPKIEKKNVKRKKSRSDQFGISTVPVISEKDKLEMQIKNLINIATKDLRENAAAVDFDRFNFDQRFRPEVCRILFDQAYSLKGFKQVIDQLQEWLSLPLSILIAKFSENIPKLNYILSTLQINGLVEIDRKSAKPMVSINYYDKCNFTQMKE